MDVIAELVEDMSDIQQLDDFLSAISSSLSCLSYVEYNTFGLKWGEHIIRHPDNVVKLIYFRNNLHSYDEPSYYESCSNGCHKSWHINGLNKRIEKGSFGRLLPHTIEKNNGVYYLSWSYEGEYVLINKEKVELPCHVTLTKNARHQRKGPFKLLAKYILQNLPFKFHKYKIKSMIFRYSLVYKGKTYPRMITNLVLV